MSERYVLLGVARARPTWFTEVARWCTSGSLPAQFVKCLSTEEVRARLGSGRAFSALLIDSQLGSFDRDLVDEARARGCAVIAVAPASDPLDPATLGIVGRLTPTFDRAELLDLLATHSMLVAETTSLPADPTPHHPLPAPWMGRLVSVCGTGGTGASTVAGALAQGLAADPRDSGLVLLADLALHADQAVLHGAGDIVPGVPEAIDAFKRGVPTPAELQRLTFSITSRHYRLLLGLRRHRDWSGLRGASFEAALLGLRQAFQVIVADVDADVEGDRQCGLVEIEDRNLIARTTTTHSDTVVVVAGPGLKGVHALARTVGDLTEHGIDPGRIVPIINRAGRRAAARSELTRAVAALTPVLATPPIFLPERTGIDGIHRDGAPFPTALVAPLSKAVRLVLDRPRHLDVLDNGPVRVKPGTMGSWAGRDVATS